MGHHGLPMVSGYSRRNGMERIAVVTGATSGIGFYTAKMLCGMGLSVIGVGRDHERCEKAVMKIFDSCGRKPDYVVGDLSTTVGVRSVAKNIGHLLTLKNGRLDILFHVAGTVSSWHVSTSEGYEVQFAVNHLAPFLLTHELLPYLARVAEARVFVVSSESHYHTKIRWNDIMMRNHYSLLAAYKQSKLCNILFTTELARRLSLTSISTYAIDPMLVKTDIGLKGTYGIEKFVWKLRQLSGIEPEVSAEYMVNMATDPLMAGRTGLYWRKGRPIKPDRCSQDPFTAKRLWDISERLCGIEDNYFSEVQDSSLQA